MKKKILIIGNTDGLECVSVNLHSYQAFFTSPMGGNWCRDEIDILQNPPQCGLLRRIAAIETADYDYVITIFLGHGGETDDGIVLIINEWKETIMMDHLMNLSQKQLLIVECCREFMRIPVDVAFTKARTNNRSSRFRDPIRQAYENRIQASSPQETILFACDQGEIAQGAPDGGQYSSHLLRATKLTLENSNTPFVSVNRAHHKAVSLMQANPLTRQHPQIQQSRCPINRRLPWAVNPDLLEISDDD